MFFSICSRGWRPVIPPRRWIRVVADLAAYAFLSCESHNAFFSPNRARVTPGVRPRRGRAAQRASATLRSETGSAAGRLGCRGGLRLVELDDDATGLGETRRG